MKNELKENDGDEKHIKSRHIMLISICVCVDCVYVCERAYHMKIY